jgi:uncharacterized protein YdhG (YjbR/CyaY superfamily)
MVRGQTQSLVDDLDTSRVRRLIADSQFVVASARLVLRRDAMNPDWHRQHVLPKGASLDQRIAWHREHARRCACRPIPSKIRDEMTRDPAIDAYLARVSPRNRALLNGLRKTIRALVQEVQECISYRLPAFRFQGRIIAGFSATSKGCSYYPFSGTTLKSLAGEIKSYSQTKSALHFDPDRPLPPALVRKLLQARIAEGKRPRAEAVG